MTDHAEEQEMEAEAMAAIFDFHFELVEPSVWKVQIYPETGDPDELDDLNHVAVQLNVDLPPKYPEVVPELEIELLKGLADEHRDALRSLANEEAEANVGSPSIFAITERIREWLIEHNRPGLDDISMHAIMMRKKLESEQQQEKKQKQQVFESQKETVQMTEAERSELEVRKRRAEGTPCTRENFEKWHAAFQAEMASLRQQEAEKAEAETKSSKKGSAAKSKIVDKSGRLTGYEFFSGKLDNLDALEAAAEDAQVDEAEEAELDAALFEEDVDLDDLSFDDDEDDDEEEGEQPDI